MYFSDSNGQIIFNILDILNSYSQLHRGCANISEQGLRQLHTLLVPLDEPLVCGDICTWRLDLTLDISHYYSV